MPTERVLNLPLSGDEIIEILLQRIEQRMKHDCFLHPAATYNGFSYDLTLNLKFKDMMMGKETLVWDKAEEGEGVEGEPTQAVEVFDSGDSPNQTRMDHGLDIPVQTQEGRRTVIRKRQFKKEEQ